MMGEEDGEVEGGRVEEFGLGVEGESVPSDISILHCLPEHFLLLLSGAVHPIPHTAVQIEGDKEWVGGVYHPHLLPPLCGDVQSFEGLAHRY